MRKFYVTISFKTVNTVCVITKKILSLTSTELKRDNINQKFKKCIKKNIISLKNSIFFINWTHS